MQSHGESGEREREGQTDRQTDKERGGEKEREKGGYLIWMDRSIFSQRVKRFRGHICFKVRAPLSITGKE